MIDYHYTVCYIQYDPYCKDNAVDPILVATLARLQPVITWED